jgi:hypothetical protein
MAMRTKAALAGLVLLLAVFPGFTQVPERGYSSTEGPGPFGEGYLDEPLVATVLAHADNELPDDMFVEIDGFSVKRSNYFGVVIVDRTYFYCLAPHFCSCPVCRGEHDLSAVEMIYIDDSSDFPVLVYVLEDELITPSAPGASNLIAP